MLIIVLPFWLLDNASLNDGSLEPSGDSRDSFTVGIPATYTKFRPKEEVDGVPSVMV